MFHWNQLHLVLILKDYFFAALFLQTGTGLLPALAGGSAHPRRADSFRSLSRAACLPSQERPSPFPSCSRSVGNSCPSGVGAEFPASHTEQSTVVGHVLNTSNFVLHCSSVSITGQEFFLHAENPCLDFTGICTI